MKYLPYENYNLKTKLNAEEVKRRLADNIEPKKMLRLTFPGIGTHKPYEGKIDADTFHINRIIGYRNSFLPMIHGTLASDFTGTTIHITMRMILFVYIFMAIWFGGVLLGLFAVLATMISSGAFHPASFIVLGMLVAGYGLVMGAFKYETRKAKQFLAELLQASEVE